jgi:DNA replication protein DnaC
MQFQTSEHGTLRTVPQRKIVDCLEQTIKNCNECKDNPKVKVNSGLCSACKLRNNAILRYAEANIPCKYWNLEIEKEFKGDPILLEQYRDVTKDLLVSYRNGVALCFAGGHGTGKTTAITNILKRAKEKNFSALYVNLSDIVSLTLDRNSEERSAARRELLMVDFLAIDEFDPRYMQSEKSSDLFGKVLEEIFRNRSQNNLPVLMSTNSPNVVESFTGPIKQSIKSLMGYVKVIPVLGKDFRLSGGG